jgi:Tol biopolymer transport system component
VVEPLGAGGMGEVYRARDPRLGRDVAVKVLPPALARDANLLVRFEHEARAVAALSDPHIVAVYDVGRDAGLSYFAAELVEGSDLRAVLAAGGMPLKRVLDLASQIASGLAAAHEKGMTHRDLKPENVLISRTGHAKIADFGLAKVALPDRGDTSGEATAERPLTQTGSVMGTAAYMSPEQAAGHGVDFRSDHFSFGSLLYEMLTGQPAFKRASRAETLAAVLREEPESVLRWSPSVPPPLLWILDRCLAKEPAERYGSTADLVKDLQRVRDHVSDSGGRAVAPVPSSRRKRVAILVGTAATGAVLLGAALWLGRGPRVPRSVLRANLDLPPGVDLAQGGGTLALSPDGSRLVIVGRQNGRTRLYLRPLDRPAASAIAGTDNASAPFFSPDGRRVGFWADGRLKKVPVAGGEASVICDAPALAGASWMPDGSILFSAGVGGLLRVSAQGGSPHPVTVPDAARNEYGHSWPSVLPGGRSALFVVHYIGTGPQSTSVGLLSLDSGRWRVLVPGASQPRFLAPGFLIVNRNGTLDAATFDLKRLKLEGELKPIEGGRAAAGTAHVLSYDVSQAPGSLVYVEGPSTGQERSLYALDPGGKAVLLSGDRKPYWHPAVSPDGSRLAVNVQINQNVSEIWVYDLARKTWLRLTAGGNDWEPVWKGDRTLVYASGRMYSLPAAGTGAPTPLTTFPHQILSFALAPDHQSIVFDVIAGSSSDLWLGRLAPGASPHPFLSTPGGASALTQGFSPDGRWLAYMSETTGREEVYVTDFPGGAARHRVSGSGGAYPCWSRDGRRIFYWQGRNLMAAHVKTRGGFAADPPRVLFKSPVAPFGDFDVAPDGTRFFVVGLEKSSTAASQVVLVPDLTADLSRLTGSR